jgi:hypothetical protein
MKRKSLILFTLEAAMVKKEEKKKKKKKAKLSFL